MHTHLSSTCLFPSLMCDVSVYRHQMHFFYSTPTTAVVVVVVDGSYWHFYLHLNCFSLTIFFSATCVAGIVYLSTFIRSDCSNMCRLAMILWICFFSCPSIVCTFFTANNIFIYNIVVSLRILMAQFFFLFWLVRKLGNVARAHKHFAFINLCTLRSRLLFPPVWSLMWLCQLLDLFFFRKWFFFREFDQMPFLFSYGTGDRTS